MPTISPATLADASTMLDIQRRTFAEEGRRVGKLPDGQEIRPLAESLESIEAHIRDQTALVARDGDRIVGSVRGVVSDRVCVVRALAVDAAYQGRGIGSALLRALEHAVADADRFDLSTNTVMEGNVPFYERHGYRLLRIDRLPGNVSLAQMTKDAARGT